MYRESAPTVRTSCPSLAAALAMASAWSSCFWSHSTASLMLLNVERLAGAGVCKNRWRWGGALDRQHLPR
eukprot:scaffold5297_cov110-Isochrysis_galbana.AAC.3